MKTPTLKAFSSFLTLCAFHYYAELNEKLADLPGVTMQQRALCIKAARHCKSRYLGGK
jgi:hypothetical protein